MENPAAIQTKAQPDRGNSRPPRVPDHELLRCIGRGSYGEVWLARNVMGTYRAVKVVFRDRFDDAKPYEREYNGIQRFEPISRSHDGLMDILQIGRSDEDGYFYYVMELADPAGAPPSNGNGSGTGIDADRYVPASLSRRNALETRQPVSHCIQVGMVLSSALAYLHRNALIHRDVKPSNIIMIGGVPKLADIGLVTGVSESFSYVGTEGFIPPEGPNSPQADIYSLGKVLYELAMGKDRLEFPDLPTLLKDSPDRRALLELNAVLVKACDADPRRRYASAEEMHRDLVLIQQGKSVRRKRTAERRLRWTSVVAVGVAGLAMLAFSIEQILEWRVQTLQEQPEVIHPALRGKIKPRHPDTPSELLDLSPYYNASLNERWYPGPEANTLAALPQGVQTLGGVPFDIRGIVQFSGAEIRSYGALAYPMGLNELPVDRWVQRLHLLGGAISEVTDGREVARVRVYYFNGESQEMPWVYGREVRALWQPADLLPGPEEAAPVWSGQNSATQERDLELRLYKVTWENPYPQNEVMGIEFLSGAANSAPFLVAVTVEAFLPDLSEAEPPVGLRMSLQAQAHEFPLFPMETPADEHGFRTIVMNQTGIRIGDEYYDGFRFTVPEGEAVDLVWGFKRSSAGHFQQWFILPMEGILRTGFEDWHHGSPRQRPEGGSGTDLCVQFLNGKKLNAGEEYFIWFNFPDAKPVEVQALLCFPKAGAVNPNKPETLGAALGLSRFLEVTPFVFHRHYCLGAMR
jgi:serine/threonine protein kinase